MIADIFLCLEYFFSQFSLCLSSAGDLPPLAEKVVLITKQK